MPYLPTLDVGNTSRITTDRFMGYNHNLQINDGEWYDTENLTTAYAPMFSPRGKRGTVEAPRKLQGIIEKDALYYIANGILYRNHLATGLTNLSIDYEDAEKTKPKIKQLVSMGAYILIFPDKKWFNTVDATYGNIEAEYSTNKEQVKFQMCHVDGTPYESQKVHTGDTAPENESQYELWIQTSVGNTTTIIKVYDQATSGWVELNTVYTKLTFTSSGDVSAKFSEMDVVDISGCSFNNINGSKMIYAVGVDESNHDYIVIVNQLSVLEVTHEEESMTIERRIPTMDYVCESQNRLWGCFYGMANGKTLNEIYCCALGDFKNWNRFAGVSTDSWVGSVGTDGVWTGCVNYLGRPTFFKENHIHVVSVSSVGAHRIDETPCRGVQRGSEKSLQIVNETLYYKSRTDVCAYQGSFPQGVSAALGDGLFYDAVSGSHGEKYYCSMRDGNGNWSLFVFDTKTGLWVREDDSRLKDICRVDDEVYAITDSDNLIALRGTTGDLEEQVKWSAESGIMYYEYPDHKTLSRYNIRLKGERGARIDFYLQYDSEGPWEYSGTVRQNGTNTVTLPIRPHRCDHMRLRMVGRGNVKIYSITKILEVGSDV